MRVGVSVPRAASFSVPGAGLSRRGRGQVCARAARGGGREEGVVPEAGG